MSLTGTYLRTIDEKQRLAVPKRLRDEMLGTDSAELYIAPEVDRSLSLFAPHLFADRAQRLVESSSGRSNVKNYLRLYYSQAERVDVDNQGRIRIPERLVEYGGIQQEVVLLGVHDHLEIWDKSAWREFFSEHSPAFDELAREAFQ
jgi:transcriptional regulator MraZ